jgi:hypothetical protein
MFDFKEWASLFHGEIFVKIAIYVDESGTHDETGNRPGSQVAILAAFAAKVETWAKFCKGWQAALDKFGAPYFHFYDFSSAVRVAKGGKADSKFAKNPYKGWTVDKLDGFLLELAAIAGGGNKAYIGGQFNVQRFAKAKAPGNPREGCANWFYESVMQELRFKWPKVSTVTEFFYDQTDDRNWQHIICDTHHSYQKINARIGTIAFADKKEHLPLQAADMLAYRLRQIGNQYHGYDMRPDTLSELDRRLFAGVIKDKLSQHFRYE